MSEKLLILNASPHRGGDTDRLMQLVSDAAPPHAEIAELYLCDMAVKPCIGCRRCARNGVCVLPEDDVRLLLDAVSECDTVALISPCYFLGFPAQAKAVIDRVNFLFAARYLLGRVPQAPRRRGLLVTCSGSADPMAQQSLVRSGKMFFDCLHTTVAAHLHLENTDKGFAAKKISEDLKKFWENT